MKDREYHYMIGMDLIVDAIRPPRNRRFAHAGPNLRVPIGLSRDGVQDLSYGGDEPRPQPPPVGLVPIYRVVVFCLGGPP